jgi:outer membrane protein TolC
MAVKEPEEEKSVSAVTWDSDHTELQANLAATEEKLKMMEAQLEKARDQSTVLSELDPGGQLVTPPPSKARKKNRRAQTGAPTGAGGVT